MPIVHGVDISMEMLSIANDRKKGMLPEVGERLSFVEGGTCSYRNHRKFDAVTALFHVINYQTTD